MNEVYISYTFKVNPLQPGTEILIAELGYAGFESFVETEFGVTAYIKKEDWYHDILLNIGILENTEVKITFNTTEIKQVNWNETWEKNFHPIVVANICTVRAPFHPEPSTTYDIVIEPKMSFGTGHHETTHMMIELILQQDLAGKSVLDMGCGTGVLAILAHKKGAGFVQAIDIDTWCYENSLENVQRNCCTDIEVILGDVLSISDRKFECIIANIDRNILLRDIPSYVQSMKKNGVLFLSGFYKEDLDMVNKKCHEFGLNFVGNIERNNWIAAKYVN